MKQFDNIKETSKKNLTKIKDFLLLSALALLLIFAVWKIFYVKDKTTQTFSDNVRSEEEIQLCTLLNQIDGVGVADVMIYNGENGEKNVVVVCEGANNILVNSNIREAVSAATGTNEKNVKIYLKNKN